MTAVVGLLLILSLSVALRFWLLGAWPVAAFCLLDGPLVVVLLALNIRSARASELILLDARTITVIRTDQAGRRQQFSFPSAWLRVDLEDAKGSSRVVLSSHGHLYEVGSFLHEPDRRSLFEALREAVHGVRNPRFDNPQLRDD